MAVNREIIDVSVRGANKAKGSMKSLGSAALKIGGAFFAAKGIVTGMSTIINSGSELKSVEMAFNNMGKGVGFSENSLKKLQDATDGTVSKLELMTKANNAMALGIVESDDQMAQMFDTAQKLGKALGQDTASALDSLVTGMGRQSKLMLDNLGIMVDTEKAYDDYAESIGKSSNELDDNEKKIAFNQAAMAEATRIANEMGDEQLTTADKISKLKNTFIDMAASVGSSADGMFGTVVDAAQGVADKVAAGLDFARTIDFAATGQNLLANGSAVFTAIKDFMLLNFEFIVQNAKKILFEIPGIFVDIFHFLKDQWWPVIKDFGMEIFNPIVIGGKIMALNTKLAFQQLWNDIKQLGVDGVNSILTQYNSLADSFPRLNLPKAQLLADVDEDNLTDTMERIDQLKEDLIETNVGGAIFGNTEEQTDTLTEYTEAVNEIYQNMADQLIVTDEEIIQSNDKVDKNKDANHKKELVRKKEEFKVTEEIRSAREKSGSQFLGDLQKMGQSSKKWQRVYKTAAIAETIHSTYKSAQDQFAAYSKSYPAPLGMILGIAAATASVGAGMARVQEIKKAQYGADFVTSGPQMMMVGEGGGPEHVQVTPLTDPNIDGPQTTPINVNISGNVMHESFIEDQVIPSIREGLRLGERI